MLRGISSLRDDPKVNAHRLTRASQFAAALPLFQSLDMNEMDYNDFRERANCLIMVKPPRWDRLALADLSRANDLNPRDFRARFMRACTYDVIGEHDLALVDVDFLVARMDDCNPTMPDEYRAAVFFTSGNVKGSLGRHKDVVADYTRALALAPRASKHVYLHRRAQAYYSLNQLDEALRDYDAAIALDVPASSPACYAGRASVHSSVGRFDEALQDYNAAVRIDPSHVSNLNSRARLHLAMKAFQAALADYEQAWSLASTSSTAVSWASREGLAACYLRTGRHSNAVGVLENLVAPYSSTDAYGVTPIVLAYFYPHVLAAAGLDVSLAVQWFESTASHADVDATEFNTDDHPLYECLDTAGPPSVIFGARSRAGHASGLLSSYRSLSKIPDETREQARNLFHRAIEIVERYHTTDGSWCVPEPTVRLWKTYAAALSARRWISKEVEAEALRNDWLVLVCPVLCCAEPDAHGCAHCRLAAPAGKKLRKCSACQLVRYCNRRL